MGRTTKDTLGLRTGTRAEVERVLDEEDGVNSDPEDFIDLEHTDSDRDSEADRIEKDVNSDDERFVDGKKVDGKTLSVVFCDDEIQKKKTGHFIFVTANVTQILDLHARAQAETEYDMEEKILDIVRGKARQRTVAALQAEEAAEWNVSRKKKREKVLCIQSFLNLFAIFF